MIAFPSTTELLASGGDSRIVPDPQTGLNKYGCSVLPDAGLIALGSSTASTISERGMAAAHALRDRCAALLQNASLEEVYSQQIVALRSELLSLCGITENHHVDALLAASGTDIHLLLAQWLQPDLTLMIDPAETGSGLAAALTGKHFSSDSTCTGGSAGTGHVGRWQGDLKTLTARNLSGYPCEADFVEAELTTAAESAAKENKRILLILTDVCKTGMIFPRIAAIKKLRQQWPEQIYVIVDACQFRLSPKTIRAYLAEDFCVALTGSKFLGGPTFSGALLIPAAFSRACNQLVLDEGVRAYSHASEWPAGYPATRHLRAGTNFGLLLRWEAAMAELRLFSQLKETQLQFFLRRFKDAISNRLHQDPHFELVPNPALDRSAIGSQGSWDEEQTIFPFIIYQCLNNRTPRPLTRSEAVTVYQQLQHPPITSLQQHRFQLGQPVLCGERSGVPVSAVRLCISAPMLIAAQDELMAEKMIHDALAALDCIVEITDRLPRQSVG